MFSFKFSDILWTWNGTMEAMKNHMMYVPSLTSLRDGPFIFISLSVLFLVFWETHHAIESVVVQVQCILVFYQYTCSLFSCPIPSPVNGICCCLKHNMPPAVLFFSSQLYPPQSMASAVCLKRRFCQRSFLFVSMYYKV